MLCGPIQFVSPISLNIDDILFVFNNYFYRNGNNLYDKNGVILENIKILNFTYYKNNLLVLIQGAHLYIINGLAQRVIDCDSQIMAVKSNEIEIYLISDNNIKIFKSVEDIKSNNFCEIIPCNVKQSTCGKDYILIWNDNIEARGTSKYGQLGLGDCTFRSQFTSIEALKGLAIKKISAGGWHNIALTDDGDIYVWGWNQFGQLGLKQKCLRCENQDMSECEHRDELSIQKMQCIPTLLLLKEMELDETVCIVDVACGTCHSIVLTNTGNVYGWGWNKYGQITNEIKDEMIYEPIKLKFSQNKSIAKIHAGGWFSYYVFN